METFCEACIYDLLFYPPFSKAQEDTLKVLFLSRKWYKTEICEFFCKKQRSCKEPVAILTQKMPLLLNSSNYSKKLFWLKLFFSLLVSFLPLWPTPLKGWLSADYAIYSRSLKSLNESCKPLILLACVISKVMIKFIFK